MEMKEYNRWIFPSAEVCGMTILVWLMIWLSNGAFPMFHIPSYMRIIMMVCAVFFYMSKCKIQPTVKEKNMGIAVLFIGLQGITILFNGFYLDFDVNLILVILLGVLTSSVIDEKKFTDAFQQGIFWIVLISLIFYWLGLLTRFIDYIPNVLLQDTNSPSRYTFMGTFVLLNKGKWTYYRNFGIFTEPGQFQIYLNIGLFIELFVKKNTSIKMLITLCLGLATCQSTNGFLVAILLIFAYVLSNPKGESLAAKRVRHTVIFVVFLFFIIFILSAENNPLIVEIMEKLKELTTMNYSMTDSGTGLERRRAFDLALQMFLKNPITGIGYLGRLKFLSAYETGGNQIIMTASPINWFARFGIIYGLLANVGYIRFYSKYVPGGIPKIIVIFAILMLISGQAVNDDYITWFIILHSLCGHNAFINRKLESNELQLKAEGHTEDSILYFGK